MKEVPCNEGAHDPTSRHFPSCGAGVDAHHRLTIRAVEGRGLLRHRCAAQPSPGSVTPLSTRAASSRLADGWRGGSSEEVERLKLGLVEVGRLARTPVPDEALPCSPHWPPLNSSLVWTTASLSLRFLGSRASASSRGHGHDRSSQAT